MHVLQRGSEVNDIVQVAAVAVVDAEESGIPYPSLARIAPESGGVTFVLWQKQLTCGTCLVQDVPIPGLKPPVWDFGLCDNGDPSEVDAFNRMIPEMRKQNPAAQSTDG